MSEPPRRLRWALSAVVVLLLLASATQVLDRRAKTPVDDAFERALVTFAVVRGINAVVSVVQGTELAIEPAGVGVILAPGEVFDPINDLIERFSWIMLAASTSLGAQKVLIDIGTGMVLQLATALALGVSLLLVWRPHALAGRARVLVVNLAVLVLFVRFAVPVVVVLNDAVYAAFLDERYRTSRVALERTRDQVEALSAADAPPPPAASGEQSLLERFGQWYDRTSNSLDVESRIALYKDRLARASEHIVHLIVVFMLQTVVFPLLFLWLWLRLLRSVMSALR